MSQKVQIFFLFLLSGLCFLKAQSMEYVIDKLSIEDGLSQSTVYSIIQDNQGFMWFATEDGLNRYDGYKFTVFKNLSFDKNSLSENSIYSIAEHAPGVLWISTWSTGINKFDVKTNHFTRFVNIAADSSSLSSDIVYAITVDHNGNVWVGAENGLNKLDIATNAFRHFHHQSNQNSLAHDFVNEVAVDLSGNIWATGFYKGVSMYNQLADSFTLYSHDSKNHKSLISNEIYSIAVDKVDSNIVWVGCVDGGIERINSSTGEIDHFGHGFVSGIPDDNIFAIETDYYGNVWAGTSNSGLFVLNKNRELIHTFLHDLNNPGSISQNSIYSLYASKSGIIWAGTSSKGINIISPQTKNFKVYRQTTDLDNSLSNNILAGLMEDNDGNLWICGWNSGLTILDRKSNKSRIIKKNTLNNTGLNSNSVMMTFKLRDGNIGITTADAGINIYNPKTKKFSYITQIPGNENSLTDNNVMMAYEDNKGIVWIGFYDRGIERWDRKKNTFKKFRHIKNDPASLAGDQIYTMYEDVYNNIWVSSQRAGLSRFNKMTEKFDRFIYNENDPNSLSSNDVMVIYQSKDSILWIGTYGGGLNKFNYKDSTFISYKETDGLPNNVIYGILEDEKGNLWLSTNKGISRFNPRTVKFRNYDISDGLQSNEFNSSYYKTSDGEMFFGGINGLNSFYPDEINDNTHVPPIRITHLQILNQNIVVNQEYNGRKILTKNISYTKEVELTSEDYVISFEFAALNYQNSQKNQYAYKLDGLDKKWNYSGTRRFATYSNLPPGQYTFWVRGSNNDNIWNDIGTSIGITVIPVYWQTWWFKLLFILILTVTLIFYYRVKTKSITDQNIKLEQAVEGKTLEMERLMERVIRQEKLALIGKISGSIAHELRNPLGAVRQSVYYLRMKFSTVSDKLTKHLHLIDSELSTAYKVIDDLLELTRLKKMDKEYTDLKTLIKQSIERSHLNEDINIEVKIPSENQYAWIDQLQMGQVFTNLIVNAAHAMEDGGTIHISSCMTADRKYLQIDFTDTGVGIKNEDLNIVFEPLYTSKAKGTGLGLSICKQIIEKHDGKISIKSELNKGTTVSVSIPYKDDK